MDIDKGEGDSEVQSNVATQDATLSERSPSNDEMNAQRKIMRKLLGQPATNVPNSEIDATALDSPRLRPSASQNTTYTAGASITCLDRSPDGQKAVIAGPEVFKILKIDGSTITEEVDLRAVIVAYATTHNPSAATSDQLNIRSVKWGHGSLSNTIFTASGNGRITAYDLTKASEGLEVARIQAHARQVHQLAICPHKAQWILSASQDGTVKSWVIRAAAVQDKNGPYFRPWQTFKCNAEAVRDVKWSPTDGVIFACCTDAGQVQKWDVQRSGAPILKLSSAHTSSCVSISWHPDGEHIVSGGMDQLCKVWDMSKNADKNQKPRYSISTMAHISRVTWRPPCYSATANGHRAAQVTVAYDDSNARNQAVAVHVWDLARPTMPFKEIEQWDSAPTGLLWNKRDLLWSVDKEGNFTQTDVAFVSPLIDNRSLSTFSFSPTGDVLMVLEERQPPPRRRPSMAAPEHAAGFPPSGSGPLLSVSRSDSEEDVVGSFLGPRQKKGHRRRNSGRSNQMSTTPPSISGIEKVMGLDESVGITGPYKPRQVMAIGHAPGTSKVEEWHYYSEHYLMKIWFYPKDELPNIRISSISEYFAETAESMGHYRLAQTWRALGYTMGLLLTRRAQHHREARLRVRDPSPEPTKSPLQQSGPPSQTGQETPRKSPLSEEPVLSPFRGIKHHRVDEIESTSNVATPLVRPVRDAIAYQTREAMHTPMVEDDVLNLPDPINPKTPIPIPVPGARQSPTQPASSVEGYDFYGMESFSPAIDYVAPPRKQPLRLEYEHQEHPERMQVHRHDSGESFQMFSTSGGSGAKFMSSSGSDGTDIQNHSLRERVSTWESHQNEHRPSIDSEALTSSTEGFTPDSGDITHGTRHLNLTSSPPELRLQEASATSWSLNDLPKSSAPSPRPITDANPNLILSDFDYLDTDPQFLIPPLNPETLFQRTIQHQVEVMSNPVHASAMILLYLPFLRPDTIDPLQALAILRTYESRLMSMQLFIDATLLRKLCVPKYPDVYAYAQQGVTVKYFCTDCEKGYDPDPLVPGSVWRCPHCKGEMAGCAVCECRHLDPYLWTEEESDCPTLPLWTYCNGCGHGGHAACMSAYDKWDDTGCCPLRGCLHPCGPGTWLDELNLERKIKREKELEAQIKERGVGVTSSGRSRGPSAGSAASVVRRDQREAVQSRAVEGVRAALGGGGSGVSVERKKSVKLVAPGEERGGGLGSGARSQ